MRKRGMTGAVLCAAMAAALLAGCGSGKGDVADTKTAEAGTAAAGTEKAEAAGQEAKAGEPAEIYMFISQPEYADAMNALIEEYKKVKPEVTINYETTQNDYPTLLKAKLNSGECPDLFSSTSGKEIDVYKEYSLDLSDQPLASSMLPAVKSAMADGEANGVYGLAIKGNYFGLIYNQDLFAQAGIEKAPETMAELEEAVVKLEASGITPFSGGLGEWWVYKHAFQHYLDAAADDVPGLVKKFENGEAHIKDYPSMYEGYFKFIDLVKEHGDAKPLEADLSTEIAQFGSGQCAMIVGQGAWVESDLKKIDPELAIGFAGYPVSDDPADCLVISGADQALRVNKDSESLPAVLDFVNWWYTSEYGKLWFTDVAGVVPPVVTDKESEFVIVKQGDALVKEKGSAPLSVIYSTDSFYTAFGEAMQAYAGGTADRDQTCEAIEKKWTELDGAAR